MTKSIALNSAHFSVELVNNLTHLKVFRTSWNLRITIQIILVCTDLFSGGGLCSRSFHIVTESGRGSRLHFCGPHPVLPYLRGPRTTPSWSLGISVYFGQHGVGLNICSPRAGSLCHALALSLCRIVQFYQYTVHLDWEYFWDDPSVIATRCVFYT